MAVSRSSPNKATRSGAKKGAGSKADKAARSAGNAPDASAPRRGAVKGTAIQAQTSPFDLEKIRELVALMDEHELGHIQIREGDRRLTLVKQGAQPIAPVVPVTPAASDAAPAPTLATPPGDDAWPPESAEPDTQAASTRVEIRSPMVGTFYATSAPDADPYVTVGAHVSPDTTVCVIEAMKVFNEIQAEVDGTVVEVLVENGQPVEYGQALFRLEPST